MSGNMEAIKSIGLDPTIDLKSNIRKILESKAYYLLNIRGVSREDYERMSEEEKMSVSYLTDDLDEETQKVMEDANMHTISGHGVPKELMLKLVNDDYSLANGIDVIKVLCKKFKELNPDLELPTRNQSFNFLEVFYNEISNDMNRGVI